MTAPFPLPVSDALIDDLRRRIEATRWGPEWPMSPWDAGTDSATLRRLAERWVSGFDWRAMEAEILALPSVMTEVRGTPIHAFVFEGETADAQALILTNGWPSTSYEMVDVARRLSSPSSFGETSRTSFTVVVPSLPGFPFSPQRPGVRTETHELWHELMTSLGFSRYGAHGGDLGSGITSRLAQAHPEAVTGIHVMSVVPPIELDESTLTDAERRYRKEMAEWTELAGSYEHQQQRQPLTLAPALSDSPVGLLAWIVEKYRAWSDCDGDIGRRFTDDFLLTQASLYWFTNSISTSFRPYYEHAHGLTPAVRSVATPTAVAVFPHDIARPPREWIERTYNLTRYTVMPRGGHFAPHEEPELLSGDIRAFFDEVDGR
ncbi:epoxide hydrolase family protein [Microbacterium sp. SLBN-146]|uniref:epoxide hydrolase family protein n=1 Tax=Microbacterium sp. SLBN-146 TaxID=2768457 RepID=UPI001C92E64C|nr:epoxide hydrolase family protein [Microbacterium sp. SLBN-146]